MRTGPCPSAARLSSWCPRPAPPSSVLARPPGAPSGGRIPRCTWRGRGQQGWRDRAQPPPPRRDERGSRDGHPGAGGRGDEGTRVAASHESSPLGCRWPLPALRSQVGTESPPGALLRCCPTAQDLIETCLTSVTSLRPHLQPQSHWDTGGDIPNVRVGKTPILGPQHPSRVTSRSEVWGRRPVARVQGERTVAGPRSVTAS